MILLGDQILCRVQTIKDMCGP